MLNIKGVSRKIYHPYMAAVVCGKVDREIIYAK